MICCSFLILVSAWIWRAGAKLFLRLGSAVALAATAFTAAIIIAEHLDHYRGRAQANERTVIAEIIRAPICTATPDGFGSVIRTAQIERQ